MYVWCIITTWRQGTQYCLHLVQLYLMYLNHTPWPAFMFHGILFMFSFFIMPFFIFYQCNEYNYIFQYKCSVCGNCLSKFSSSLKSVIQHQKSIWGDFLVASRASSGIHNLLGLLLTCITESAFFKDAIYLKMMSPCCIFFMMFFIICTSCLLYPCVMF